LVKGFSFVLKGAEGEAIDFEAALQVGVWPRGDVLFTTVREVVH